MRQIAATGAKTSIAPTVSIPSDARPQHGVTSSPPDGTNIVSNSDRSSRPLHVAVAAEEGSMRGHGNTSQPRVHVQTAEAVANSTVARRAVSGKLTPTISEDSGPRDDTSSGSGKPLSLDGKSTASGTTFTLDEKDSLRPDDSASVQARDDDEVPPAPAVPVTMTGSVDNTEAFRDQLKEICRMEPSQANPASKLANGASHTDVLVAPSNVATGPRNGTAPTRVFVCTLDPKLVEALESPKDRIMVLKLEQDIVDFINGKELSLKLPQTNAFYRMLAHKLADYYKLGHVADESTMAVQILRTPHCRLARPLTATVTSCVTRTPPPGGPPKKILRRGESFGPAIADGSNTASKTTSENGESGDEKKKAPMSLQQREERYEAVRKRIMGSAKPAENGDDSIDKDHSRCSSAAGKKFKKKQRLENDDDFEARSAYYAVAKGPDGTFRHVGPRGPMLPTSSIHHWPPSSGYDPVAPAVYPPYGMPSQNWGYAGYPSAPHHVAPPWAQHTQDGYDLSANFHRAMSLPHHAAPPTGPPRMPMPAPPSHQLSPPFQFPLYAGSMYAQPSGAPPAATAAYSPRPPPPAGPAGPLAADPAYAAAYPYGQLPSQAFPGRPASKLEHPLPGSYKGRNFNPQSQTFVPTPHEPGVAPPVSSSSSCPSPAPSPAWPAPLTHPLPQPVFPRLASPIAVSLPARPEGPQLQQQQQAKSRQPKTLRGHGNGNGHGNGHGHGNGPRGHHGPGPPLPTKPLTPAKLSSTDGSGSVSVSGSGSGSGEAGAGSGASASAQH